MLVTVDDSNFQNIAQAIRAKNGTETTYKPNEMAAAIEAIESGGGDSEELFSQMIDAYKRPYITSVTFPDGIKAIANSAFAACSKLVITELPTTIDAIGVNAFDSCFKLALTSLPSGITYIGSNAFSSCDSLAITELPEALTEIQIQTFSSCKGLTTMTIPAAVQYVRASAFSMCTNLTSVTFKGTPEGIASNAFNHCTNLTTINVPWAEGAVANAPWGATNATINYNYVPPITFTIDGVKYYSEPNTNWYNWVDSEYNTDGRFERYNDGTYWRILDATINNAPNDVCYNGSRIIANSIILADAEYYTNLV